MKLDENLWKLYTRISIVSSTLFIEKKTIEYSSPTVRWEALMCAFDLKSYSWSPIEIRIDDFK